MINTPWNPWKTTAIGLALMTTTALVTGVVVAHRQDPTAQPSPAGTATQAPTAAAPVTPVAVTPARSVTDDCNRYAASHTAPRDNTVDTVRDVGVGALVGAAVGAAGGAIAGGGKGAGKGAAIGGLVGAGGGTVYGLNENKKHDDAYRASYARCMRSRGFEG